MGQGRPGIYAISVGGVFRWDWTLQALFTGAARQ